NISQVLAETDQVLANVLTPIQHPAATWFEQTGNHLDRRTFSRTVRPQASQDLSCCQMEGDTLHGWDGCVILRERNRLKHLRSFAPKASRFATRLFFAGQGNVQSPGPVACTSMRFALHPIVRDAQVT